MSKDKSCFWAGLPGYFWPLALIDVAVPVFWLQNLVLGVIAGTVINSFLTAQYYRADKHFAQTGTRRIPEKSLHLWELFWGWPGALYAQVKYRHKNAKLSFQLVFWCLAVLNVAATGLLLYYVPRQAVKDFLHAAALFFEEIFLYFK